MSCGASLQPCMHHYRQTHACYCPVALDATLLHNLHGENLWYSKASSIPPVKVIALQPPVQLRCVKAPLSRTVHVAELRNSSCRAGS